jgi:hypothetical protein
LTDLVETLVTAAGIAIRNQASALTSEAGTPNSITITLDIANNGDVIHSRYTVERRGVHRSKGDL